MEIVYLLGGLLIGAIIAWLFVKQKSAGAIATLESQLQNSENKFRELSEVMETLKSALDDEKEKRVNFERKAIELEVKLESSEREIVSAAEKLKSTQEELSTKTKEFNDINNELATSSANYNALLDKQETQKKEIEKLNEKFSTEFQNIANRILEEKTEKFTASNKINIEALLKPLGENLDKFKSKVEEVYDKESKERFSLGEKVKELAELNHVISEEAKNLTRALKGESKTQGRWGEMILESILEKSGLVKDREYFMEHQLVDDEGKAILSESEGKKMRPDAVIKYPDNRSVIIDSKVSLTAFTRYLDSTDPEVQKSELIAHVSSIKTHIVALSSKGYDDYNKALDFVMMFIPSEPAYIAAMQGDPDLWNFAYDKRILLLNPTNLITSLKLIVDLWKREYQNQNAIEIADRGTKLLEKFSGFVTNMQGIDDGLRKAQTKYDEAFKQLSTGNDNLVLQATKLKNLGLKPKKDLPQDIQNLVTQNTDNDE
ncbi:MAG: DNA recombination protein RmuC [Crocinitomicaceae bacterium]|nr:DNA recombination protein RmuC [Crocinitomicaceae bacterium]